MKNFLFTLAGLAFLFSSCKKEEVVPSPLPPEPPAPKVIGDYTKFSSGNYWVFEMYRADSNGNETYVKTDSCFASGDTVINGESFSSLHFWQYANYQSFYRDSSSFLIDEHNHPYLTTAVINDTFYSFLDPGVQQAYYTVTDGPSSFSVPAGTFDSLLDVTSLSNLLLPFDTSYNPWTFHTYFAKGIGKIYEEFGYASQPKVVYKRRMVRYYVM